MNPIRFLLCLVLCLSGTSGALAQPSAAAVAALTPRHVAALHEIIDMHKLVDIQLDGLRNPMAGKQDEMARQFFATVTSEGATQLTLQVLARHVNEEDAVALVAVYRPAVVKRALKWRALKSMRRNPPMLYLTRAESDQVFAADNSVVAKRFMSREAQFSNDCVAAWKQWYEAYTITLAERFVKSMRQSVAAAHSGKATSAAAIVFDRTGVAALDQTVEAYTAAAYRIGLAERTLDASLAAAGVGDAWLPSNILAPGGVAKAKLSLDSSETLLAAYMREVEGAVRQCEQTIRTLELPNKAVLLKTAEATFLQNYTFMLRFGETQRQILDVMGRVVLLLHTRRDWLSVKDGVVTFQSQTDLDQYQVLMQEMKDATSAAEALAAERRAVVAAARLPL